MSSLQQNASFLTFLGELTSASAFRLLSVMLQACDWLREDLAELARSCCAPPNGGRFGAIGFFMTCWVCDLKIFNRMRAPRLICRSPCVLPAGGAAISRQTQPRGRGSGFGRCCFTIAQPYGLSARDGRSGGAPTWCSGL